VWLEDAYSARKQENLFAGIFFKNFFPHFSPLLVNIVRFRHDPDRHCCRNITAMPSDQDWVSLPLPFQPCTAPGRPNPREEGFFYKL
jgi:hypothetical protein